MSHSRVFGLGLGILLAIGFAFAGVTLISNPASAANNTAITANELLGVGGGSNQTIGEVAGLGSANLQEVIARIIRAILGFLGVVAVVIILWGGFKWMTSGGEETKVKDARKLILMGIVGLAIVLSAWAIATFVITSLVGAVTA